jgi:diketogulonate reductase-like aldo/keto reductase
LIYREFAKTGFKSSVIGMGTYYDPWWMFIASALRFRRGARTKLEALKAGLEHGINLIDTAEAYQSEPIVAEAIRHYKRDEVFVATKVSYPWNFSSEGVVRACERSLKRLQTSYIDLYQIHYPPVFGRTKEVMKGMEKLLLDGKIRAIGVSNFSLSQMKEAESALSRAEISSNQVDYSLMHREPEKDLLPFCEANKKAVLAYFPLAHGRLAWLKGPVVNEMKARTGAASVAQIALNWLVSRSPSTFAIPRASRPQRVLQNSQAMDFELSPVDMKALENLVG